MPGVMAVPAVITGPAAYLSLLIPLGILAVVIWAIVDVARRPPDVLPSRTKAAWIVGMVVGTLLLGIVGMIVAIVYLVGVRPRLSRFT